MPSAARCFKLALAQIKVGPNKAANLATARAAVARAARNGSQVVALPECFNSPYGTSYFNEYAEQVPGETSTMLAECARENNVYLIGGSFPEREGGQLFNTCLCFGRDGKQVGKFRKLHLFDIDVPGGITFKESDVLVGGNQLLYIDTEFCKIGVGICYDIRFPKIAELYRRQGCDLIVYPGAFNMTTGPAHWELLQRARALDNQMYVAAVSPARDTEASYVAWGHSTVVGPWGDVIATCDEHAQLVEATVDLDKVASVRTNIPISKQERLDIYTTTKLVQ